MLKTKFGESVVGRRVGNRSVARSLGWLVGLVASCPSFRFVDSTTKSRKLGRSAQQTESNVLKFLTVGSSYS